VSGHYLAVTAATTSTAFTLDIAVGSNSFLDSIVMVPTGTGTDARWGVSVMNSATTDTLRVLATSLPNLGYNIAVGAELPGAYPLETGQVVRCAYSHSTGTAQTLVFLLTRLG
jgi:hypothetical protein